MKPNSSEELLRHMASEYMEQLGAELRKELEELEKSKVSYLTPRLDERIRRETGAGRRPKKWVRLASLLAAGLVLLLLVPQFLRLNQNSGLSSSAAAADNAVGTEETPQADGEKAAGEMPDAAPDEVLEFEVIPITFALPRNLEVAQVTQDEGKTVYYLQDANLDDIVLTMEETEEQPAAEGLVETEIAGHIVYALAESRFQLITFQKSGILYVLTCQHDLNTLVPLAESILLEA